MKVLVTKKHIWSVSFKGTTDIRVKVKLSLVERISVLFGAAVHLRLTAKPQIAMGEYFSQKEPAIAVGLVSFDPTIYEDGLWAEAARDISPSVKPVLRALGAHVWCNFQGDAGHDPASCTQCQGLWSNYSEWDTENDPEGVEIVRKHFPSAELVA